MAEVVHVLENPVRINGDVYTVQVCGRPTGNIWEGWIEFVAADHNTVYRTRRETTQPDREALQYWATGLSGTYVEGALKRTFEEPPTPIVATISRPYFDGPAPPPQPVAVVVDKAVLDPFSVGAKGEVVLRQELGALAAWHLRNIVRAYDLTDEALDVEHLSKPELVQLIVSKVQPV